MESNKIIYKTIDEYIAQFSSEIQEKLNTIRKIIKETAPDAEEKISWQMPTFAQNGNIIHFAAFKNHIGLFPGSSGIEAFMEKLSEYKTSKGTIQIPFDKPIPVKLIKDIVKFRVKENLETAKLKKKIK